MLRALPLLLFSLSLTAAEPDWAQVEQETLRHFQALLRMDTQNPPGNESQAAEYLKKVLEAEGIPVKLFTLEPNRANLVARLKGSGKKRPLLLMAHTDVVRVLAALWTHPPFSATRDSGYIYGRGAVDDKDNLAAVLMTMLLLKRHNVPLDRDVIFLGEAGEEASTQVGIEFMVREHWSEIEAEICLAEGGAGIRRKGKPAYVTVQTAEKIPYAFKLAAKGPAGHGSRPLKSNSIARLSQAVARIAQYQAPMRMNDTTRYYFERLATVSAPEDAARYNALYHPEKSAEVQQYLADYEPGHNSMLRTSISPNMIRGGFQVNVIPSSSEATLDVRALPDENMDAFRATIEKLVNDPQIEVLKEDRNTRPAAPPSRLDHEAFPAIEAAWKRVYPGITTIPSMSTGATDMAYLRAKGVQCYGIGPMIDEEDGPLGYGAHSDQERILEKSLHEFVRFKWDIVKTLAGASAN
ncbi:MAG TPA: M20/M25/M40 family metallo-hydrolase [Bryobacteraceae bacterium]|nr:peptidase M20 [Bryobacterales bacterium]HRJ19482.1 M20/M25/M40 family metallo-hydrolase [Bryobacteraceae bacterium]